MWIQHEAVADRGQMWPGETLHPFRQERFCSKKFFGLWEFPSIVWRRKSACRRGGLVNLCRAGEPSPRIPALRLVRYSGMEAQFWLNLQTGYDLLRAEQELDERLEKEVTPHAA